MREYTISTLVGMVDEKELVLPAMQRPFVWDEQRMVRLVDSLLRRFPLGTLLVWATSDAQRYRAFRRDVRSTETPAFTFEQAEANKQLYYVLDGQQRLTTLYIALKGTLDDRKLHLDVLSGDPEDKDPGDVYYDLRFLTANEAAEINESSAESENGRQHFVSYENFLRIDFMSAPNIATGIAQKLGLSDKQKERMSQTYTYAAGTLASNHLLKVHVIDENQATKTPIEEILEIFVRVNSGGLVLNKADLLMSLLDLSWNEVQPQLMSIATEMSKQSPVEITRDMILKSSLLYIDEDSRFHELLKDRNRIEQIAPKLKDAMEPIRGGLNYLRTLLKDDCRINSPRFFRQASNALLPFVVYLARNPDFDRRERHKMAAGLYIALMSGVFGSAEARMGNFARKQCNKKRDFPLKELADLTRKSRRIYSLDDLLSSHRDLTLNIAKGGVYLDDNPDELERDHIFPKALLEKQGYPEHKINHYANFHFLRKKDNRNKQDKPPDQWFRSPGKQSPYSDTEMKERLLDWYMIEPGNFEKMLEDRGTLIREETLKLFHMEEAEFNSLFTD